MNAIDRLARRIPSEALSGRLQAERSTAVLRTTAEVVTVAVDGLSVTVDIGGGVLVEDLSFQIGYEPRIGDVVIVHNVGGQATVVPSVQGVGTQPALGMNWPVGTIGLAGTGSLPAGFVALGGQSTSTSGFNAALLSAMYGAVLPVVADLPTLPPTPTVLVRYVIRVA